MAVPIRVRQRTPEWLSARRSLITGTDVPAILGISPWKSEADVAADKQGAEPVTETIRMRIGTALEPLILRELECVTGREWQRMHGLWRHDEITWAAASPDAKTVAGPRRLGELKWSGSRSRWADGLPQDVEAQVRWTLGVLGWPAATVAALVGDELKTFDLDHDEPTWAWMVERADNFRTRLAAGGPFSHSTDSVKRMWPADDGSEIAADAEVAEAVERLVRLRAARKAMEADEAVIETALKARMGEAAVMAGDGFRLVWRKTKDRDEIDWRALADELLAPLPETERVALVGRMTTTKPGFRPFRVVVGEED